LFALEQPTESGNSRTRRAAATDAFTGCPAWLSSRAAAALWRCPPALDRSTEGGSQHLQQAGRLKKFSGSAANFSWRRCAFVFWLALSVTCGRVANAVPRPWRAAEGPCCALAA